MADFRIAVGETTPAFQRTLKSDNVAVDLTGATVTFSLIKHGLAYINNAATTAVTPASGIVKYVWQAGDLTDTGFFTATFKVVYPSTAIEYFEFTIEVIDGAGIVAPVTPPALDFATQAELDAHINDTTAAHAASAISNTPAGNIAATTVQAAINELDTEKVGTGDSRLTDSRIPTGTAGGVLAGTYPNPSFAADMATQAELDAHTGSSTAHTAANIVNVPAGNIAATTVQDALNELDTEKAIDSNVLHLTGVESASGAKNFTTSVQIGSGGLGVGVAPTEGRLINLGGTLATTQVNGFGVVLGPTFPSAVTSAGYGAWIAPATAAAAFTCANMIGLIIRPGTKGAGSTITNLYGIQILGQTAGTNNHSMAIGASSTSTLWVGFAADDTTAAAGIQFGASRDTNLYRSAADTLKTDDSLAVSGSTVTLGEGTNFVFGTTTGTKIGTTTTQKISFFNKTPIVQPTTGITGAAFVAGSGTAVNDASTFGGYTLKQIAAALINLGILA